MVCVWEWVGEKRWVRKGGLQGVNHGGRESFLMHTHEHLQAI